MKEYKLLSVILPVYNVEQYLERCIRSLEAQDLSPDAYEIVVVNDGSPDKSGEVVSALMEEFSNIVYMEQENRGVSIARNAGIDSATGKYLLFVDPDDFVERNSFARICRAADEWHAQVTFLGYRFLNYDGSTRAHILNPEEKGSLFPGVKAYHLSRGDGKTDPDRSVAILYERAYINRYQFRFTSDVPYLEDGEFLARVLCCADRCLFEGNPFYLRTTRQGSATNSNLFFSERAINGFIRAAHTLVTFRKQSPLTVVQREFLNQPICKFILLSLASFGTVLRIRKLREVIRQLESLELGNCDLKGCNRYYYIEGRLYNLSPYLYVLHTLLRKPLFRLVRS